MNTVASVTVEVEIQVLTLFQTTLRDTILLSKVLLLMSILLKFAMASSVLPSNVRVPKYAFFRADYLLLTIDKPLKDVLNAAQSAAMAQNLDSQLDYLITGT